MSNEIFGYYWQLYHVKTGEPVNDGFCFSNPPSGDDPDVKGFAFRSLPLAKYKPDQDEAQC